MPLAAPPVAPPVDLGPGPDLDDGPAAKRARGEDSLIPEAEFMARNPPQVTFKVMAPVFGDKPEWNLHGQVLQMTLSLRDQVSAIKARSQRRRGCRRQAEAPDGRHLLQ